MTRQCDEMFCFNDCSPGRKICGKCRSRKWRAKNPLLATFNDLKSNAKRRGVYFGLTVDEWKQFCDRTSYLNFRGQMADSFTVDRIDPRLGYTLDNIQVLSLVENARKAKRDRKLLMLSKFKTKEQAGTPF